MLESCCFGEGPPEAFSSSKSQQELAIDCEDLCQTNLIQDLVKGLSQNSCLEKNLATRQSHLVPGSGRD